MVDSSEFSTSRRFLLSKSALASRNVLAHLLLTGLGCRYEEYRYELIEHLVTVKLAHWEKVSQRRTGIPSFAFVFSTCRK